MAPNPDDCDIHNRHDRVLAECSILLQLNMDLLRHSFTVRMGHHLRLPYCPIVALHSAVSIHLVLSYFVTLTLIVEQCNGFAGRPVAILSGAPTLRHLRGGPVSASACCRTYPGCSLAQRSLRKGSIHDCWFQQPKCFFLCRQVGVSVQIAGFEIIRASFG
jgi:hypothetical protein